MLDAVAPLELTDEPDSPHIAEFHLHLTPRGTNWMTLLRKNPPCGGYEDRFPHKVTLAQPHPLHIDNHLYGVKS
jgi:hypothetical protein